MNDLIKQRFEESIAVKQNILESENLIDIINGLSNEITNCIKSGAKILLCGNGGSASDALHFAGEIVGRFQIERPAWPAIVLNADVATMTAVANDYGYNEVFARQAEAYINKNDILIGISTSGNSENVYRAILVAQKKGIKTAALLGKDGGKIGKEVDFPVIIPCMTTARVQESHITIIHIVCELVEKMLAD